MLVVVEKRRGRRRASPGSFRRPPCSTYDLQLEPEDRAFAELRVYRQLASMGPHDASAEVEAQARARDLTLAFPIAASAELLEDPDHVVGVYAFPTVGDLDADVPAATARSTQLYRSALWRVLGGVREEVAQNLPDSIRVGKDPLVRIEVAIQGYLYGVVAGEGTRVSLGVGQKRHQRQWARLDLKLVLLGCGGSSHVGDEGVQCVHLTSYGGEGGGPGVGL